MRALLNSLGLTLWSSIAIILAVGLAMVGYRLSLTIGDSPLTRSAGAGVHAAPAIPRGSAARSPSSESTRMHGEMISHIIGPEMIEAQASHTRSTSVSFIAENNGRVTLSRPTRSACGNSPSWWPRAR